MKLEGIKSRPVGRGGVAGALALPHSRKRSTFFIDQRLKRRWSNSIVLIYRLCSEIENAVKAVPSPPLINSEKQLWENITAVIDATFAVAKRKPEKNSGLHGIRTIDLCDTGAAFLSIDLFTDTAAILN